MKKEKILFAILCVIAFIASITFLVLMISAICFAEFGRVIFYLIAVILAVELAVFSGSKLIKQKGE